MENLHNLADLLIGEADKMAAMVMHEPGKHLKELDIIAHYCDIYSGICESIEFEEKFDKDAGMTGLFHYDNPHRRKR